MYVNVKIRQKYIIINIGSEIIYRNTLGQPLRFTTLGLLTTSVLRTSIVSPILVFHSGKG